MGFSKKSNSTLEPTNADVKHQRSEHPSPASPKDAVKDDAESLDVKVQPIHEAKTGTWKAAKFLTGLALGDWQMFLGLVINLVPYLIINYRQSVSKSSTITTDFVGFSFLLAVLGGFVADSFLGAFYTVLLGGTVTITGLALLTFVATSLEPPGCQSKTLPCHPAGIKYMGPLYVALYTIALGTGLARPTLTSLAADQFDESVPAEKSQIYSLFIWFYFLLNIGIVTAFTLGIYLQTHVSRGWGYGFSLILYGICFAIFVMGTPRIRRKRPSGSFLTRMAQVLVASMRKWSCASIPDDLYDPAPTGKGASKTIRTNRLRCMDRAAIIDQKDKKNLETGLHRPDPWRLCSVAQVEETKQLLQLVPIWASTTVSTLVFSMLATFTIQQGMTMNRNLGRHFTIPAASLGTLTVLSTFATVPIYNYIIVPIVKRFTGSSYGLTPIHRMGISLICSILAMLAAGLVERRRLTYVHELHFERYPLGFYSLPMSFLWLLPQAVLSAQVEFFFFVSAYEFFFFESSEETRNIGSSFTFSSAAIGYFTSAYLVNIINSVTRHSSGGSWLLEPLPGQQTTGQLNTGGLAKFYFFLAVYISVAFVFYCTFAYFYKCNHDWYGVGSLSDLKETTLAGDSQHKPLQISSPEKEATVVEDKQ